MVCINIIIEQRNAPECSTSRRNVSRLAPRRERPGTAQGHSARPSGRAQLMRAH